jgi:hypothetical protein
VSREQAEVRLTTAIKPVMREQYAVKDHNWRYGFRSVKETLTGEVRETLWLTFAAVGLVLLIAIANVANLLLARGTVRPASWRSAPRSVPDVDALPGSCSPESALLGLAAGSLGLVLAFTFVQGVRAAARDCDARPSSRRIRCGDGDLRHRDRSRGGDARRRLPLASVALGAARRVAQGRGTDGCRWAAAWARTPRARRGGDRADPDRAHRRRAAGQELDQPAARRPRIPRRWRAHVQPGASRQALRRRKAAQRVHAGPRRTAPSAAGVESVAAASYLPVDQSVWTNNYTVEGQAPDSRGADGVSQWNVVDRSISGRLASRCFVVAPSMARNAPTARPW